jgi:hypothetical protein
MNYCGSFGKFMCSRQRLFFLLVKDLCLAFLSAYFKHLLYNRVNTLRRTGRDEV